MGMDQAKSLLPVRGDRTFLDVLVEQVRKVRSALGVSLPLLFMNSFRTRDDTLAALAAYPDLRIEGLPAGLPAEPGAEAPRRRPHARRLAGRPEARVVRRPGHGDLYTALDASGILEALIDQGYRYASVSNADNLGAAARTRG